jgi:predicted transcriptional regulator
MEYSKLTKQELINHIESLACEDCGDLKVNLSDANYKIKDLQKSNDDLRKSEYDFRSESSRVITNQQGTIQSLEEEKKELKLQIKFMETKFNELAEIFEEYVKAFKDQNALLGAFNRNREYIENHLDLKINKFNNGGD